MKARPPGEEEAEHGGGDEEPVDPGVQAPDPGAAVPVERVHEQNRAQGDRDPVGCLTAARRPFRGRVRPKGRGDPGGEPEQPDGCDCDFGRHAGDLGPEFSRVRGGQLEPCRGPGKAGRLGQLTSASPAMTRAIATAKPGVTCSPKTSQPAKTPTSGVMKVKAESCAAA